MSPLRITRGRPRPAELTTAECLDVIRQLAELGTREISLIGGEAFIRKDWLAIIRAVADHGIDCSLQTGAFRLSAEMIRQARDAGLWALGVSLDGLAELHDHLRGVRGSYAKPCAAGSGAGPRTATSVNRRSRPRLFRNCAI